jgi:hypothetical protein
VRGDDRISSHMEFAFWRPRPSGAVEVVSAHPNGVAQIEVGSVEGSRVAPSLSQARNESFGEGRCPSHERLRRRWRRADVRSSYGGCWSTHWPAPARGASPRAKHHSQQSRGTKLGQISPSRATSHHVGSPDSGNADLHR